MCRPYFRALTQVRPYKIFNIIPGTILVTIYQNQDLTARIAAAVRKKQKERKNQPRFRKYQTRRNVLIISYNHCGRAFVV